MNTVRVPTFEALPDEQDIQLNVALSDLQNVVAHHYTKPIIPLSQQSAIDQQLAIARLNPYVKFEFSESEYIWSGLPIECTGFGGFMSINEEGRLQDYHTTNPQDSIRGLVSDVFAYNVPDLEYMIQMETNNQALEFTGLSPSVILILEDTHFFRPLDIDNMGLYNLTHVRIGIPLVYGMQFRVSDTFEIN